MGASPGTMASAPDMEDLPPAIDPAACGKGVTVSADRGSATSSVSFFGAGSRVALTRGCVRGRTRIEFRVDGSNIVAFGYALVGASCAVGYASVDVGTQCAVADACFSRGVRIYGVPWCGIPVGGSAALLFDMDEGTLGYEVNGEFVGTLFRDLSGLAIAPVFFVHGSGGGTRLTVTRVRSSAGAFACPCGGVHMPRPSQFRLSCARWCRCRRCAWRAARALSRRGERGRPSSGCAPRPLCGSSPASSSALSGGDPEGHVRVKSWFHT